MPLAPEQQHLLKRELLQFQLTKEAARLDNLVNVDLLGSPFVPLETPKRSREEGEVPLCSFFFKNFIVPFPLLAKSGSRFWPDTCQPFIQDLASKDISSSADRDEATKRRRIGRAMRRVLLLLYLAGMGRGSSTDAENRYKTARHMPAPENNAPKQVVEQETAAAGGQGVQGDNFGLNDEKNPPAQLSARATVIGARAGPSSSFFKSKETHYLIESQLWGSPPVWVERTYPEFSALQNQLIKHFPGKALATLPLKTENNVTFLHEGEEHVLLRESQRRTLRAYLTKLCSIPKVASCEPLLEFLFRNRRTELTEPEIDDVKSRIEIDKKRFEDGQRFFEMATERAAKLEKYISEIKSTIMLDNALPKLFWELRKHSRVEDMSPLLQKLVEWSRVEISFLIYDILIARDNSPEIFGQVKRFHRLIPYKIVQGILKLSNPAMILKKMTDLFMATPFGGKSLLQNMLIRVLADDMRSQDKLIEELHAHIGNEEVCGALHAYAYFDYETREKIVEASKISEDDLVLEIVKHSETSPATLELITKWYACWNEAVHGSAPDDATDVEMYSCLKDLLKLEVRQRDKDIMQEFWADPATLEFIKFAVHMLYDVLIDMFRVPGISDCVGDLEMFMSELIAFISETESGSVERDANAMVDGLIELCCRHQNSVFVFVHRVYSRDKGFFIDVVSWCTRFINFIKDGKDGRFTLDVDTVVSDAGVDMEQLQKELDSLDQWLVLRKTTADPRYKMDDTTVSETFDVKEFGLSWEDVDYGLAETERDEQEEFVAEIFEDLSQDAVTRERNRLYKQRQMLLQQNRLPPRPSISTLTQLQPYFERKLCELLNDATVYPSDLDEYETLID